MSVSSTRRVSSSLSYNSSVKGGYEAAQGSQSFIENIDTSNNVSVQNENGAQGRKFYQRQQDDNQSEEFQPENEAVDNGINLSHQCSPLFDNDSDTTIVQSKNVGIYEDNQEKSNQTPERRENPYVKHLYEHNENIEEVDEFI
ncbi:MAG: hypothetical protein IJ545_02450 [Alphaproteobacteria bacterium]|nr:hypothetical protein [Alphaproteobacteria bacterium]